MKKIENKREPNSKKLLLVTEVLAYPKSLIDIAAFMIKAFSAIFGKVSLILLGKMYDVLVYVNPDKDYDSIYRTRRFSSVSSPTLSHIAFFVKTGNAGDVVLPAVLQDLMNMEHQRSYRWNNYKIQNNHFDKQLVRKINNSSCLIIGGGGLFLRDTNPNQNSGWQWNCSIENLKNINVPICLFAVGYNRFRGQGEFDPVFQEHINLLAEKAFMLGLRNHGSLDALKSYLDPVHFNKLVYQPCMTTLLDKIYGDKFSEESSPGLIAVNCAFDRSHLRYGENIGRILSEIALACKVLSRNYRIAVYSHLPLDDTIIPFLQSFDVPYDWIKLYKLKKEEIIRTYAKPSLVIGMRGHAQLIPFGLQIPTISLISHDKLRWFLDDINHTEWAIEVTDNDISQRLIKKSEEMLQEREKIVSEIVDAQEILYKITQNNLDTIRKKITI